jgi:F0F1-type ATP synthase alpha subunit
MFCISDTTSTKPKKKKVGSKKNNKVTKKSIVKKKTLKKKKIVVTYGTIVNVSDEIVYCIGLSKIKFGEIVFLRLNSKHYEGLVVNIS